jgi:hypothetical protein
MRRESCPINTVIDQCGSDAFSAHSKPIQSAFDRSSVILFLLAVAASPGPASKVLACDGVSDHAYRVVVRAAIDAMPDALNTLLDPPSDQLARASIDPDGSKSKSEKTLSDDAHYLWLDVDSLEAVSKGGRGADVASFPREREEADAHCRKMIQTSCGSLPWSVAAHYQHLVLAFESGRPGPVLEALPPLFHLVTDAAMPLNVTSASARGLARRSRSAQASVQAEGIDRLHARLAYEVRVWPERVTPVADPTEAVFALLIESYEAIDALRAVESNTGRSSRNRRWVSRSIATQDSDALAALLEERLESGALLAARLVTSAWDQAGRPTWAVSGLSLEGTVVARSSEAESTGYAGSRDSTVFHGASCAHVARIKPENLVRFTSLDDAVRAGRKPCRSCKPGSE